MSKKKSFAPQKERKAKEMFDLAIAWNWEYDQDFAFQINQDCLKRGLKPYLIQSFNLEATLQLLGRGEIGFSAFFDRASDADYQFLDLVRILQQQEVFFINDPDKIKWIDDKVLIHMDFMFNNIPVPPTFIYYPTDDHRIVMNKIRHIGIPFVVKPAHNVESGNLGVLLNARTAEDVFRWHAKHKNYIFLLQKQIVPCLFGERWAWFRVFSVMGKIIPCWWHPSTHIYQPLTEQEINKFKLDNLFSLTEKIGKTYKLGLFSTEIAVEAGRNFVVIDYINDQCDMRKKTRFIDGVPDETIEQIIKEMLDCLQKKA